MGTWNYGIFDNDDAYDFVEEIKKDAEEFFARAFNLAGGSEIDSDLGVAMLVSAAYLDNYINGTEYRIDGDFGKHSVNNYKSFAKIDESDLGEWKAKAVHSLNKVLSKNSELRELWEENEELYPKWKKMVEELINRLK